MMYSGEVFCSKDEKRATMERFVKGPWGSVAMETTVIVRPGEV